MSDPGSFIRLDTLINRAIGDCAERVADGKTMTATYKIQHTDGEMYAVTIDPLESLGTIITGRQSHQ